MTAAEFLRSKCSGQSLPPEFDHLDMSLLCFLAGKHAPAQCFRATSYKSRWVFFATFGRL